MIQQSFLPFKSFFSFDPIIPLVKNHFIFSDNWLLCQAFIDSPFPFLLFIIGIWRPLIIEIRVLMEGVKQSDIMIGIYFVKVGFLGEGFELGLLFILPTDIVVHKGIVIAFFVYGGVFESKVRRTFLGYPPCLPRKMTFLFTLQPSILISFPFSNFQKIWTILAFCIIDQLLYFVVPHYSFYYRRFN